MYASVHIKRLVWSGLVWSAQVSSRLVSSCQNEHQSYMVTDPDSRKLNLTTT